jgi:hypothetical protein
VGGGVIRENADDVNLIEILERRAADVGQLAADDKMEQLLLRGVVWHDSLS